MLTPEPNLEKGKLTLTLTLELKQKMVDAKASQDTGVYQN